MDFTNQCDSTLYQYGIIKFAGNCKSFSDYIARRTRYNSQSGCIEWIHVKDSDGYGLSGVKSKDKGWEVVRAHRLVYALTVSPIPASLMVLHRCDNPCCVNPVHLMLGTAADNLHDSMKKGRFHGPTGELNGQSKLTKDQVLEIRKRYQWKVKGQHMYDLAREFGVKPSTIHNIIKKTKWKSVP